MKALRSISNKRSSRLYIQIATYGCDSLRGGRRKLYNNCLHQGGSHESIVRLSLARDHDGEPHAPKQDAR
jgi:hypothetical protein